MGCKNFQCVLVLSLTACVALAIEPILIIHGGSGAFSPESVPNKINGMKKALEAGYKILLQNKSSLDAVEKAVRILEENENFNAGNGSVLTEDGEVEMDAAIMNGAHLRAGCVSLVKTVTHPITLARFVMERTNYAFLGGLKGTTEFAIKHKMEVVPFKALVSAKAKKTLAAFQSELYNNSVNESSTKFLSLLNESIGNEEESVGAVAIDINGNISVASSAGGKLNRPSGQVSSAPILGSGTYADNLIGGAVATGDSALIQKFNLVQKILHKIKYENLSAHEATEQSLHSMKQRFPGANAGAISVDYKGNVGFHTISKNLAWGFIRENILRYGISHSDTWEETVDVS